MRCQQKDFRSLHGFTLVELLVVISIVALLISMLLPAVKKAKESARQTQCGSQHRQLAIGTVAFANDHRGWLLRHPMLQPSAGGPSNISWDSGNVHAFIMASGGPDDVFFLPYFSYSRDLFFCPSNPIQATESEAPPDIGWGWPSPYPGYSNWVATTLVNLANINPIDGKPVAIKVDDNPTLGLWADFTFLVNFDWRSANHPAFFNDPGAWYNFGAVPPRDDMIARNLAHLGGDVRYERITGTMKFRTQMGPVTYVSY